MMSASPTIASTPTSGADPCAGMPWPMMSTHPNPWCSVIIVPEPVRLHDDRGVHRVARDEVRRPDRRSLLVRDERDEQVAVQAHAGLHEGAQREERDRDARLVVRGAAAHDPIAVALRHERLRAPVRVAHGVRVRVHAQGPAAGGPPEVHEGVRPARLDVLESDLAPGDQRTSRR